MPISRAGSIDGAGFRPAFSILYRKRLPCTGLCEDAAFLGIFPRQSAKPG